MKKTKTVPAQKSLKNDEFIDPDPSSDSVFIRIKPRIYRITDNQLQRIMEHKLMEQRER